MMNIIFIPYFNVRNEFVCNLYYSFQDSFYESENRLVIFLCNSEFDQINT